MRSTIVFSSIILAVAGCDYDASNGVSYPAGEPATITLSVSSLDPIESAGDTRSVTAVVNDATGSLISSPSLSWRTSTPAVATVAGSGESATITAVDDGTAVITATTGRVQGTVTVTVRRRVVAIVLSAPDSVVVAGSTVQLTVIGHDARQQPIAGLTGVSFRSSNQFSVLVAPDGLVTALFSPFQPLNSIITATLTRDGVTLSSVKRIDVGNPAPPVFDLAGLMLPESVRPEPVDGLGQGIIYLTLDGARVQFKILWSLLTGPPVSAHIHGPDGDDSVAPVLVDLALGNQSATNGVLSGSFSAPDIRSQGGTPAISLDSVVTLMQTGFAYVDMHTTRFSDGEMRGPIARIR